MPQRIYTRCFGKKPFGEVIILVDLYPVCLKLDGKKCLIVGGGKVAERKVKSIIAYGAKVYVVSPQLTEWMEKAAEEKKITVIRRNYTTTDLENAFLVVGATDNQLLNNRIAEECHERDILVNIVDDQNKGNFIVPAVLRQGSLIISIATNGKSPMLARRLREELAQVFGPEYGEFLELMSNLRDHVISTVPEESRRRDIFYQLVYSDIIDLLRTGQHERIKERVNHVLGSGRTQSSDGSG